MFPQIFGKYVLERELAAGGMARVFLATLRGAGGFEKRLVVKQIRPELASDQSFIQRFVAEAKTTVALSHANIVPVYELGAEQGTYYIAMEYCPGVSLAELLRGGALSPSEGAYIGVEICRALDYAHRKAGVVHRDVTPRNVMIDPEGMVRLIDFGIAAPASTEGQSGPSFGSPGHMPPEQLRPGPLTPAADVFAVAVLLIEVWTGQAPFRRESLQASARALAEPRRALGETDPSLRPLDPLLASALRHAPSDRPQTAEELARPLREFLRQDDLGDTARRLGRRVSERLAELARGAPSEVPAHASSGSTAGEPARVSGTQTFAAHEVLREWTAKIDSTPPRLSTAALQDVAELESGMTAPAPSRAPSGPGRRHRRGLGLASALAALALLFLGLRGEELDGAAPTAPAPARTTAPITEPRAMGSIAADPRGAPPSSRELGVAVSAASTGPATNAAASVPSPTGTASAAHAAASAPSAHAAASAARATPARPSSSPATAAHRAAPAAAPVAALQLTAEPAAWVEIDAARVGRTPLASHGASPGLHTIAFINELLGERIQTTVTLDPSHLTRVHADFTSANPRVYVR